FTVDAEHDLLERGGLFGLGTLSTPSDTEHRLPGLADGEPLFLNSARQSATASFGPHGFRAAAVTAFGMAVGAAGGGRSAPPRRPAAVGRPGGRVRFGAAVRLPRRPPPLRAGARGRLGDRSGALPVGGGLGGGPGERVGGVTDGPRVTGERDRGNTP